MSDGHSRRAALQVPFGDHYGRMVAPDQVDRGLACECVCPGCGEALVANQGAQKRAYFSHYHGSDCADGYESALHAMAKQLIVEHSRLTLPPHTVVVETSLIDDTLMSDKVVFPARTSPLFGARQEVTVDKWRPDVVAGLKNGATLHIEVLVTHEVEPDKAAGIDNLMEIDLSEVPPEKAADANTLREIVTSSAPRHWYRVSLYDDLDRVHRKRRDLNQRARRANEKIRTTQQQQQAKHQQEVLDQQKRRDQNAEHIDVIMQMTSPQEQKDLRETRRQWWSGEIDKRHNEITAFCASRGLPLEYVGVPIEGDWIIKTHPIMWQYRILSKAISYHDLQDDIQVIDRAFGFDPSVAALTRITSIQANRRRYQVRFSQQGPSFLNAREREALVTPHDLLSRFFEILESVGYLEKCRDGDRYRIVGKLERQRRQYEESRKEQLRQRINSAEHRRYCVNMLESFLSQRVTDVRECLRCWALTRTRRAQCPRCGGEALADTQLDEERVEKYRQKLASLPD